MRVFADKFTTTEDRTWLEDELTAVLAASPDKGGKEKKGKKEEKVCKRLERRGRLGEINSPIACGYERAATALR